MKEDSIFINRELSWLDFNRRVLVLGKDKNVPLAEQLKFLAIYGSNLDEFFMVRVGSLQERASLMRAKKERDKRENKTNMTAEEQLAAIMPKTAHLQEDCDKYYEKALENLAACGYKKVDFDALSKEEEHFWKKYFQSELFPILSPQIVDSRHPFPFLRNKEIYLGVLLKEKEGQSLGMIPSPARWSGCSSSAGMATPSSPSPRSWCCTMRPSSSARTPCRKNAFSASPATPTST